MEPQPSQPTPTPPPPAPPLETPVEKSELQTYREKKAAAAEIPQMPSE